MAFTNYMIAIETMVLVDKKRNGKKCTIANRAACVIEREASMRGSAVQKLKGMYDTRSNIVHEGHNDIPLVQVHEIRTYATNILLCLLEDPVFLSMKSSNDLMEWFRSQITT